MKNLYKILKISILALVGLAFLHAANAQAPDAPTGLEVKAFSSTEILLMWTGVPGDVDTSYVIQVSTDSVTFESADTVPVTDTIVLVENLTEGTDYNFHVFALSGSGNGDTAAVEGSTTINSLAVHLEMTTDTTVKNILNDSIDKLSSGEIEAISAEQSGIGLPAIKFIQDELGGINTYVRLYNTVLPVAPSLLGRTVAFWMKNDQPSMYSVPISVCKRTGFSIAVKNGILNAFTKHRPKYPSGVDWLADSTGVAFDSDEWIHVAYVFDNPVTRLFVNGVMVDESDGVFTDGTNVLELPFPTDITVQSGGDKSAEIGAQVDPDAATVIFLGDTWDPGPRNYFFGMLADIRMYNYSLSDEEILDLALPGAPENLRTQAWGPDGIVIRWDAADAPEYQIEISTDSSTFEVVDTTAMTYYYVTELDEGTDYYFRVTSMNPAGLGGEAGLKATTLTKAMVVDMPLDSLVGDTAVYNAVDNALDKLTNGTVEVIDATTSGLGIKATKFVQDELGGIQTYVRLYNTIVPADDSWTQRTVTFWMKNNQPGIYSVPISVCKRTGFSVAIKNGMIHGFTKHRPKFPSGTDWVADSTGTKFNSDMWTHVAYVFDHPVTRLYVNGGLVDESDGIVTNGSTMFELPFPTDITVQSGGDKSAEIGAQVDPDAATVSYLGDTWDPGPRHFFDGMMAKLQMYNFALSDDSIESLFDSLAVKLEGLMVQASGAEDMVLRWNALEGATGYKVETSTDGTTWTIADTADADNIAFRVGGLTEATTYHFRVTPQHVKYAVPGEIEATTLTKALVVHLEFAELVGDTALQCSVSDALDDEIHGQVEIHSVDTIIEVNPGICARFSGLNAIKFIQDELGGIESYVRLYNTLLPAAGSLTDRSVAFFMKNEMPDMFSVPISVCKRTGFSVALKDGKIHAFTRHRPKYPSGVDWLADSTGAVFSSSEWIHVVYVFDDPVTRLYVNGVLVDESDGIFEDDGGHILELPFPTEITVQAGGDKSAEIGAQVDPDAATVSYLGDTWDPGPRHFFNGEMADLRIYNYSLSALEIQGILGLYLTLSPCVSVRDIYLRFNVYPNPASDILYISNIDEADISVFDNVGKLVLKQRLIRSNHLDVSSLSEGMYYLRISTDNATEMIKISVVR